MSSKSDISSEEYTEDYTEGNTQDYSGDYSTNVSLSKDFPYVQQAKNHTLQIDSKYWKIINELPPPDEFWVRRDKELLRKYESLLDYIESLALTVDDVREFPLDVLKLFELTQCLLEVKDADAENSENLELDLQDAENEIATLKNEISKLKFEHQTLKNESSNNRREKIHDREIEDKNVEIAEWKNRCFEKDVLISKLTSDIDDEKRKAREAEVKCVKLENNIQILQDEVSSLSAMEEKMRNRNAEDDQLIQELEDNVGKLEDEKEELRIELEETTDKVIALEKDLAKEKQIEKELRDIIQKNKNEIITRIKDDEHRQREIETLKEEIYQIEQTHKKQIDEQKKTYEAKLSSYKNEIQTLMQDIHVKESTIMEYTHKLTSFQETILKQSKTSDSHENMNLASSVDSKEALYTEYQLIHDLKKEIASLKSQLNSRSIEFEPHQESEATSPNKESLNQDSERLKRFEEEKTHFINKIILLEQNLSSVESELVWSKQKIMAYEEGQTGIDIAKREIQYHKEQLLKREATIQKYKSLLNILLNKVEELKFEILKLYKKYNHPDQEKVDVNKLKEDAIEEILDSLLSERLHKVKNFESELEILNKELEERIKLYPYSTTEYNNMKKFLESQIEMLQSSNSKLTSENQSLMNRIDKLTHELQEAIDNRSMKDVVTVKEYEDIQNQLQNAIFELSNFRENRNGSSEISQIDALKEELHQKYSQGMNLQAKIQSLEVENSNIRKELSSLRSNSKNSYYVDKPFAESATESVEEIEMLRQRLKDAEEHLKAIKVENIENPSIELKRKLIDVQSDCNSMRRKYEDSLQQLNLAKKQNEMLRDQVSKLSDKVSGSISFKKGIPTKDYSLQEKLEAEKNIRDLQRRLEDANDEIAALKDMISDLKEREKAQKLRDEELKDIQTRLQYYEQSLKNDHEAEKILNQNTMKQIVAGYNAMITQKDRAIDKYLTELEGLRLEIVRQKKSHEEELEDYKQMLKSKDTKFILEMQENIRLIENQVELTSGSIQGMALEDVEEIMANKNREIDQLAEENTMLKNRVDELEADQQNQYSSFHKMKKHLESEIEGQESEIQSLRLQLADLRAQAQKQEISTISIQTSKKKNSNPTLSSDLNRLEMKTLKEELEREMKKNYHLRESMDTLSQNLLEAQRALRKKQKFEAREKELSKEKENVVPKQHKDLDLHSIELNDQISKLKLTLEKKQKVIENLQAKFLEAQREISAKESVISRMNESIQRLNRNQKRLQKEIESYQKGDNDHMTLELEDMEKKLKVLQQKNAPKNENLELKSQMKEKEITELKKQISQLEESLHQTEKNYQRENQKLQKRITILEEENQASTNQLDSKNNQLKALKLKLTQAQQDHEKEMKELKAKVSKEIRNRKEREGKSLIEHSPKKDELDKLALTHKQELQKQKEKFESTIHTLTTDLQRLKMLSKEKDVKLQQLQHQVDSLSNASASSHTSDVMSKIEDLRRNLGDYYSLKEEYLKATLKAQQEKDFYELQLSHMKMKIAPTAQEEADYDSDTLNKQKELLALRFENEEMKQKLKLLNLKLKDLEVLQAIQIEVGSKDINLNVTKVISNDSDDKSSRQDLEKVIDAMKLVITKVQDENEKLKKNVTTNREYMDLMNKQKNLKSKLAVKTKEIEKLQKDLEVLDETREKVTKTLEQNVHLTKKMKKEKEITAKHKKECEILIAEKEKLEAELKKIRELMTSTHNAALSRQKMLHNQKIAELSEQKQSYKLKNDQLRNRIKELEKNEGKQQVINSEFEKKLEEEKLELRLRIQELESELKKRSNEPSTERATEVVDANERNQYKKQLLELTELNTKLKLKLQAIRDEANRAKELSKQVAELERQRDQLLEENKEQKEELDQFDESFFEELEDLKYKYMEARRLNDDYRTQLEELGIRVDPPET